MFRSLDGAPCDRVTQNKIKQAHQINLRTSYFAKLGGTMNYEFSRCRNCGYD